MVWPRTSYEYRRSTFLQFCKILNIFIQMWHRQRKQLTPTFHYKILNDFAIVMNDCARTFVTKLQSECQDFDPAGKGYYSEFLFPLKNQTCQSTTYVRTLHYALWTSSRRLQWAPKSTPNSTNLIHTVKLSAISWRKASNEVYLHGNGMTRCTSTHYPAVASRPRRSTRWRASRRRWWRSARQISNRARSFSPNQWRTTTTVMWRNQNWRFWIFSWAWWWKGRSVRQRSENRLIRSCLRVTILRRTVLFVSFPEFSKNSC